MIARSVAIIIVVSILLTSIVFATHGHWIDHYSGAIGKCCGPQDCLKIPMRIVSMNEETVTLDIQGNSVTILRKSFHLSEDTTDLLCLRDTDKPPTADNIRCAFIAIGI